RLPPPPRSSLFPYTTLFRSRCTLGFLPLGTGNSFLRDFSDQGVDAAMAALLAGRTQTCDVLRLKHTEGVVYYINLLSVGFTADRSEEHTSELQSLRHLVCGL